MNQKAFPSLEKVYKEALRKLQNKWVELQRHLIKYNHKIPAIFESRDASGKDDTTKRCLGNF